MFRWTGNVLWRTKCTRSKTNVRNGTNASMHWCLCIDGEWPPRQWEIPRKNCTPCCSGFVVREVLMIHVGGTRDVTWSIDQSIQIHLGCWIDPSNFFFMVFFVFFVFFDVWLQWWVWSRLTLYFDLTFRWHACLHRHSALWKRNHAVLHVRGECLALVWCGDVAAETGSGTTCKWVLSSWGFHEVSWGFMRFHEVSWGSVLSIFWPIILSCGSMRFPWGFMRFHEVFMRFHSSFQCCLSFDPLMLSCSPKCQI